MEFENQIYNYKKDNVKIFLFDAYDEIVFCRQLDLTKYFDFEKEPNLRIVITSRQEGMLKNYNDVENIFNIFQFDIAKQNMIKTCKVLIQEIFEENKQKFNEFFEHTIKYFYGFLKIDKNQFDFLKFTELTTLDKQNQDKIQIYQNQKKSNHLLKNNFKSPKQGLKELRNRSIGSIKNYNNNISKNYNFEDQVTQYNEEYFFELSLFQQNHDVQGLDSKLEICINLCIDMLIKISLETFKQDKTTFDLEFVQEIFPEIELEMIENFIKCLPIVSLSNRRYQFLHKSISEFAIANSSISDTNSVLLSMFQNIKLSAIDEDKCLVTVPLIKAAEFQMDDGLISSNKFIEVNKLINNYFNTFYRQEEKNNQEFQQNVSQKPLFQQQK
ncbi:hypothetical protein PPERSA_02611 [Pseudocohnilembus persalinus]|uniref:Uncharacterized protein n=1 Tax=Pseudocohnilembus persalinus TaxID=266149 RepID=A0A0V0R5I3_PSEPJ|nr:hypothetical protein PPERSA_02611 [Pseudocohnilembus persalinus]|eukprot:KRX09739.1 hypothetical protein PPERSA_02611 [Pseudocohnilembus persalinus]